MRGHQPDAETQDSGSSWRCPAVGGNRNVWPCNSDEKSTGCGDRKTLLISYIRLARYVGLEGYGPYSMVSGIDGDEVIPNAHLSRNKKDGPCFHPWGVGEAMRHVIIGINCFMGAVLPISVSTAIPRRWFCPTYRLFLLYVWIQE